MEWFSKLNLLASHNEDIKQLLEKGYAVTMDSGYLVIRDIPYLDESKVLKVGAFVSKVDSVDDRRVKIHDHQMFFCGSHPHQTNGSKITNLGGGPTTLQLESADLVVERSFSNKPPEGFTNFFDKVESYVDIICGPAMQLFDITPLTFKIYEGHAESVFKFSDTLTSRAEIGDINQLYKNEVIAIIGLGGTGSYILDLLVKTPVKEIRGFDLDDYHVHNAFRSPGRLIAEELGKSKAEILQSRYENFRHGVNLHRRNITEDSDDELTGVTFAFACVDKGKSREQIFSLLIRLGIPFIDVGMGLERENDMINGMARVTYFPSNSANDILTKRYAPLANLPQELYKNTFQISELNALNACLAVVRYKQIKGFYIAEAEKDYNQILFSIDDINIAGE